MSIFLYHVGCGCGHVCVCVCVGMCLCLATPTQLGATLLHNTGLSSIKSETLDSGKGDTDRLNLFDQKAGEGKYGREDVDWIASVRFGQVSKIAPLLSMHTRPFRVRNR